MMSLTRNAADEEYAFSGDVREDRSAYWVRREGRVVYSRTVGYPMEMRVAATVAEARGVFAEETCDPDGPGAPRPGDTIELTWIGRRPKMIVADVRRLDGGDFEVSFTNGTPRRLQFMQYRIVERPEG